MNPKTKELLRAKYGNHGERKLGNKLLRDQVAGGNELLDLIELMNSDLPDCCRHSSDAQKFIDAAETVRSTMIESQVNQRPSNE